VLQIDINVEREVLNHKQLVHPNVVQFKEVRVPYLPPPWPPPLPPGTPLDQQTKSFSAIHIVSVTVRCRPARKSRALTCVSDTPPARCL
jgi:hypothetical protein